MLYLLSSTGPLQTHPYPVDSDPSFPFRRFLFHSPVSLAFKTKNTPSIVRIRHSSFFLPPESCLWRPQAHCATLEVIFTPDPASQAYVCGRNKKGERRILGKEKETKGQKIFQRSCSGLPEPPNGQGSAGAVVGVSVTPRD